MVNSLSVHRKTRRAIRHQAFTLRGPNCAAEIGPAGPAEFTLATLRNIQRNHMIAGFDAGDIRPNLQNDSATFMAHYSRENSFRISSRQRKSIRVADTGGFCLKQDLATFGSLYFDFFND